MGDCNTKQLPVDDVPDAFETLRGEKGSKITQKIHSPTAQAFSKSILPNQLRDKSHDVWLHPSVKFLSDSVGDASVLLTTQNSGSNECHVESHSIDTTESSDVVQEIRFQTEKLRDSTDQANLLRVVDTREIEAGATCGTMQAAFGNSTLPNADNGKHSLTFIACPHGCETAGLTEDGIETHIKESCSALTVNCSFEKVECGVKGTQYTVEKHEEESTRHHLGLMCSFAERQQLELKKLQSQIEVQTKEKKNSGIFLRVGETSPSDFSNRGVACFLEGIDIKQYECLKEKLLLSNIDSSLLEKKPFQTDGQFLVDGITAMEFMSFLRKEYAAKIVAHSFNTSTGRGNWTLEVNEL